MKKIFVLCIIILGGVSCDPPEHLKTHYTYWYVKNATNEPISITTVPGHLMSILTIIDLLVKTGAETPQKQENATL